MLDTTDQRILRRMNEAGQASYVAPDLAKAIGVDLVDAYARLEALEASGHVVRQTGSDPRAYSLTFTGMEAATAA